VQHERNTKHESQGICINCVSGLLCDYQLARATSYSVNWRSRCPATKLVLSSPITQPVLWCQSRYLFGTSRKALRYAIKLTYGNCLSSFSSFIQGNPESSPAASYSSNRKVRCKDTAIVYSGHTSLECRMRYHLSGFENEQTDVLLTLLTVVSQPGIRRYLQFSDVYLSGLLLEWILITQRLPTSSISSLVLVLFCLYFL
jgi:hypothetical protein